MSDICKHLRAEGKCGVERFKDSSCGYEGTEGWCDRTRTRCAILGNSERFDGAMPDVKEPWEVPYWDIACGLGLISTFVISPPWWLAGTLYTIFSFLIVPQVRQELYYRWLLRQELQNDDSISKD